MSRDNRTEHTIEELLESKSWYVISPFHCVYGAESDFGELEEYLFESWIQSFSDKISMIVSKLICLYPAYIAVTDPIPKSRHLPFELTEFQNIRDLGLKKITQIIGYIIHRRRHAMNIYFPNLNSLIQISGGVFAVAVFSEDGDFLNSVDQLVNMEGLCVRYRSDC